MRNTLNSAAVSAIVSRQRGHSCNRRRTAEVNGRENDGGTNLHLIPAQMHHACGIVEDRGGFVAPRSISAIGGRQPLGAMFSNKKTRSHRLGRLKELSH